MFEVEVEKNDKEKIHLILTRNEIAKQYPNVLCYYYEDNILTQEEFIGLRLSKPTNTSD